MCKTVIADDVSFAQDDGLGAFRVQIIQNGVCEVEVIIKQATMQQAISAAMDAIALREARKAQILAFR